MLYLPEPGKSRPQRHGMGGIRLKRNISIYLKPEEADYLKEHEITGSQLFHAMFLEYTLGSSEAIDAKLKKLLLEKQQLDREISRLKVLQQTHDLQGYSPEQTAFMQELAMADRQFYMQRGEYRTTDQMRSWLGTPAWKADFDRHRLRQAQVEDFILQFRALETF